MNLSTIKTSNDFYFRGYYFSFSFFAQKKLIN